VQTARTEGSTTLGAQICTGPVQLAVLVVNILLTAIPVESQPQSTRARDFAARASRYRGDLVIAGSDAIEVYRVDGSRVKQATNQPTPGVWMVDVFLAGTHSGDDEVAPSETLALSINGVAADQSITAAHGQPGTPPALFQFSGDGDVWEVALDVPVGSVSLAPDGIGLAGPGATQQLSVRYHDTTGLTRQVFATSGSVVFTSTDVSIATVDDNGLVMAQSATGSAIVSVALVGGVTASAVVETGLMAPTLAPVGPAAHAIHENQAPVLSWDPVVTAASYELDLGRAPDCESIANDLPVSDTSYASPTLADGSYCWRVRTVGSTGARGPYATNSSFDTIPAIGPWGILLLALVMAGSLICRRGEADHSFPGRWSL
jgi:hypothetical protein